MLTFKRLQETVSTVDNLYLYGFLILIGTLIVIFNATGGVDTLAHIATARLRTKKQVETTSIVFSFLMFIDDYLSILTVGHVIKPIIRRFNIPSVKLAYLVHSLAGVVVILAPLSSWVATITAQLHQAGVSSDMNDKPLIFADPFFIYLNTIPFLFYSLLTIMSVLFIVRKQISFGPMHAYEKKNNSTQGTTKENSHNQSLFSAIPVMLPIIALIVSMIIGILYSGNFWLFGGKKNLIQAIQQNNNPFLMMFVAAIIAVVFSIVINFATKKLRIIELPLFFYAGFDLMRGAIIMVFLSATLGTMLKNDIFTGKYLASMMIGSVSLELIPALFFVVSLTCAIATGSAWGTFSLMLSIIVPMLVSVTGGIAPVDAQAIALLFPSLGALFSGAVCGDHISPISETTIMAATSSGCSPIDHAKTQFYYALPAVCWTLIGFIIAGYTCSWGTGIAAVISLGVASVGCLGTLNILNHHT